MNRIMLKVRQGVTKIENGKIRRAFDDISGQWYFSIVDIMGVLTETTDARNYWKVLKNRLKKTHNELVTKCNQLKMLSRDGKFYSTDVADPETILELIGAVDTSQTGLFREYFDNFLRENPDGKDTQNDWKGTEEAKLLIDASETNSHIYVRAMVAGVSLDDLSISVSSKKVIIRGKRKAPENIPANDYLKQELLWTNFARIVSLPSPVKTDEVEIAAENGLLTVKLKKIIQEKKL